MPIRRSPDVSGSRRHIRIAVADDDPETLEVLRDALGDQDIELHEATSGAELLSLLAEGPPFDLVVTDVSMSWMSGLQVMLSLRNAGIGVPAVVITGLADPELPAQVSRLGRARLLRKPVGLETLLGSVRELLEGSPPA
ncbi:MAG TPA: response regulator [Myxococcaceae bacterium]|nr:response regulator [Myxococcaceae bacterium]